MPSIFPYLVITADSFSLSFSDGTGVIWRSVDALGNIVAALEEQCPDANPEDASFWVDDFLQAASGAPQKVELLGFKESGASLAKFYMFIDGRTSFAPSQREIEQLRIQNAISSAPLPYGPDGFAFGDQHSLFQIIYSILYFCAFFSYRIKKCKLCGKWFAASREAAQEKFCNRPFSYVDFSGKAAQYVSCKDAAEKIRQRLEMRRRAIYNHLAPYIATNEEILLKSRKFDIACDEFKRTIRDNPSIDNYLRYERFLYDGCKELYKKYGREKRNGKRS